MGETIALAELVACVDRELALRAKAYPRWVRDGKLTQTAADVEMSRMRHVRMTLLKYHACLLASSARAGGLTNVAAWEAASCHILEQLLQAHPEPA